MRIQLESKRLILRNLTPDDYQAVFLWCGDPDVARYMVYPVYTKAEAGEAGKVCAMIWFSSVKNWSA